MSNGSGGASQWISIDKLGTKGMEPDLNPSDREPQSLDIAVNMRPVGPNLSNAGGYSLIDFGTIPDEPIVSNCDPCPQMLLTDSVEDGTLHWDRSWTWIWTSIGIDYSDHQFIGVFEINKGSQDYDQTLVIRSGECNENRQQRVEIEILNTSASRRVRLVQYDAGGAQIGTPIDHDASAVFGDGNQHWVIVHQRDPGASQVAHRVWIDNSLLGDISTALPYVSRFTSIRRANSPFGLALPIAFYQFSQTLLDCLTSGNFNGFGRCTSIRQQSFYPYDRSLTDADLDLYRDNRIVTPKIGTATRRTAYVDHPVLSGRFYWECIRDMANCKNSGTYWGGVTRGAPPLGTVAPGAVPGSWGYAISTGRLQVDGNPDQDIGQISAGKETRTTFCLDTATGEIWIGGGEGQAGDPAISWIGGGEPLAGATSWNVGLSASNMRIITHFSQIQESHYVLSSAESCRHAPPAGFNYIADVA